MLIYKQCGRGFGGGEGPLVEVCVHHKQYMNTAQDSTNCHGVSLEGGLVLN